MRDQNRKAFFGRNDPAVKAVLEYASENSVEIFNLTSRHMGRHTERVRVEPALRALAELPAPAAAAGIDKLIADLMARKPEADQSYPVGLLPGMKEERQSLLGELQKLRQGGASGYQAGLARLLNGPTP